MAERLTKKQLKAQQFKKTKEERGHDKSLKRATENKPTQEPEQVPKKRKTRRGRKGRSRRDHHDRFIVFVGNMDKQTSSSELQAHFKSSSPDHIRLRSDKGIAFLEFEPEKNDIQRRMDLALLQHKTTLRGRQINVELTVGGGGNSNERLQKLHQKNQKLIEERRERARKMIKRDRSSQKIDGDRKSVAGIHPDRARLLH